MIGVQTDLAVSICEDASDAVRQGYFYRQPVYLPIKIIKAVVIKNGTQSGGSSVDFILEDEKGQKYVVMITGAILKAIPC